MFTARGDDEHILRCSFDADHAAIFGHQHIAAAYHGAAWQEYAQGAPQAVLGIETAFLAHVPIQFNRRGALEQHGSQAMALGKELVDGQHRGSLCTSEA